MANMLQNTDLGQILASYIHRDQETQRNSLSTVLSHSKKQNRQNQYQSGS